MKHRTALITAGSIAAVVFAGAIAVGANLGILTVADSRPVGQLSAATVVQTSASAPKPTQEYAGAKKAAASQKYIIKKAGAVKVAYTKTVSYTHLRAHETRHDLVCRLLLEKKKK